MKLNMEKKYKQRRVVVQAIAKLMSLSLLAFIFDAMFICGLIK